MIVLKPKDIDFPADRVREAFGVAPSTVARSGMRRGRAVCRIDGDRALVILKSL